MALIDITPVMASNTTPAPYVVTASSESNNLAYYAFDNTESTTWTTNLVTSGWIKIDFGSPIKVNALSFTASGTYPNRTPKSFIIYGSNDDSQYELISSFVNEILWTSRENRLYKILESNYRYYKIVISDINGADRIGILEIKFWQDNKETEYISNKKASLNYCLPKNSTLAMTQRQNDPREGLLGFANDPDDRYGTLYMIDDKGQAIMPKSKIVDADILFDGLLNTEGSIINLPVSINKYREVIIEWSADINTEYKYKKYHSYFTKDIVYSKTIISVVMNHTGSQYAFGNVEFNDEFTIKLSNLYRAYFTHSGITKIYGIK